MQHANAGKSFTMAHTKKILRNQQKKADMVLLVALQLGLDYNCPVLK